MTDTLDRLTEPEEIKLRHLAAPHKNSRNIRAYETLKKFIARNPVLSERYDYYISIIITYLNV